MADHVRLFHDLTLAAQGLPIKSKATLGFSGSYNYGKMRIAAAYAHAIIVGDKPLLYDAREIWLDNEHEQLTIGHWCHAQQCEQLCPQPHSEFLISPCCLVWREAIKQDDNELSSACEAEMGRSIAAWKVFNLGGIVCAPSARAKDPDDKSNDAGVGQWRNRPADAILSRVLTGKRGVRFNGLSVQLFDQCMGPIARGRLASSPFPKLRVPIRYSALPGGGYATWYDPTDDARHVLGRDALTAVIHRAKGRPDVYYDFAPVSNLPQTFTILGGD